MDHGSSSKRAEERRKPHSKCGYHVEKPLQQVLSHTFPTHPSTKGNSTTNNNYSGDKSRKHSADSIVDDSDWSTESFYDLPCILRDPFQSSLHLSDLVAPSQVVNVPPHYLTAEALKIHAFLDSSVQRNGNPYNTLKSNNPTSFYEKHYSNPRKLLPGEIKTSQQYQRQYYPLSREMDGSIHPAPLELDIYDGTEKINDSNCRATNGRDELKSGFPNGTGRGSDEKVILLGDSPVPAVLVTSGLLLRSSGQNDTRKSKQSDIHVRIQASVRNQASHLGIVTDETGRGSDTSPLSSPESDSVLSRSSSGIAADIESSRSSKSHLVESPRGLIANPQYSGLSNGRKETVGGKSASFKKPPNGVSHIESNYWNGSGLREDEIRRKLHSPRISTGQTVRTSINAVRPKHVQSNVSLMNNYTAFVSGSEKLHRSCFSEQMTSEQSYVGVGIANEDASPINKVSAPAIPTSIPTRNSSFSSEYRKPGQDFGKVQMMSVHNEVDVLFGRQTSSREQHSNINRDLPSSNRGLYRRTQTQPAVTSSLKSNSTVGNGYVARNGSYKTDYRYGVQPYPEKAQSTDGKKKYSVWKDLSLMNSFSVDTSRRISSAVWAMKLMEAEHTSTPATYQQLLLKARIFRRWYQRARLRRLLRLETDSKMNSAVTFWQTCTLHKFFSAWKKFGIEQQQQADEVYRRHMLQTGVRGLRFAVQVNTQTAHDVMIRVNGRIMAKFWLKWQNHLQRKRTEILKTAFNRWRVFKLEGNRDRILDGMAKKHILSRNYFKWKMKYSVEQNNSVAGLHFKIVLLTKSWHSWRVYTAQRVVKSRLKEVARVHYEDHLQARVFYLWIENSKKSSVASTLLKRRIVVKAFYSWRNWTEYAKVIHQRFQSMCKEYYNRALIKQTFIKWRQKLLVRQAEKFHGRMLQKRVYRLWFLRFRRKVIHRRLCKAMSRKGKKRRFFRKWLDAARSQRERRHAFVNTLQRMRLTRLLRNWRERSVVKKSLRECSDKLVKTRHSTIVRKSMDKWLFAKKVANFRKQARVNWSRHCVRKACEEWKLLMKRKYLEEKLIENRPARELWVLRAAFAQWKKKKLLADKEQEWANRVAAILARNTKRRVLQAWRVANQQEQIIAPMVSRRQRKHIARAFDAWRLHIYRQKFIVDQHVRADEKIVDRHFLHWRQRTYLRLKEREATERLLRSKMSRAFKAWRGHVRECRHDRLKDRAHKLQLMATYFKLWTEKTHARIEAKEIELAYQSRQVLLVRWAFKSWRQSVERQRQRLDQAELQVSINHRRVMIALAFRVWLRLYQVAEIARNHLSSRREQLMRKVFQAWVDMIKEELRKQVRDFTTALSLDLSIGSNLGSTFRSFLGSTNSDLLSSSGYGTSMRRGSGSEFPFPSPRHSQRDDDVASLPGRMDQLPAESPKIHPASPITVLRESTNSHSMSPRILHSPSPCDSPAPEFHLQLYSSDSSESYFTPVKMDSSAPKAEDLTGVHSSSHSEDDEYEHMSVTSGFSCASVRDKEMVLTDTILHWRSLPLSLTFRTWLKYTRQRKLLRELLYYAREKKTKEIMIKTIKTWRRELYTKVAARQYLRDGTRLRCLRAWHRYVETRRNKEEDNIIAEQQCHMMRLRLFFGNWRNKYTAKKRIQSVLGQWQKKAVVTEKHKAIGNKIQKKQDLRELRERFLYWANLTRKSQEARRHYLEILLPRFFLSWRVFTSNRANNRRKGAMFQERRLLSSVFREWQVRYVAARKAEEYLEVKETSHCLGILRTWYQWANGVSTRRAQWRGYRRSVEVKTMREIFTAWFEAAQQLQNARRIYEHSIMRRVLLSWRDAARAKVENKYKVEAYKETRSSNLLARSFKFWQRLLSHRQLAVSHALQRDRNLLSECYEEWREFTLDCRAEKHYLEAMVKKVYFRWYDQYLSRKKTRRLLKSWKSITEDSKMLNNKAVELCQQSERKLLQQTFTHWVQEAHKIQKAKNHCRTNTMISALIAWHQHVDTRVRCRRTLTAQQEARNQELLSKSFRLWRDSFMKNVVNLEALEDHLEKKQRDSLSCCMLTWRKYTLKCRAGKHYNERTVFKYFMEWRHRLIQRKGLQNILQKIFYRRTRQAALHWKHWTLRTKRNQMEADYFQLQQGQRLVQAYFVQWLCCTKQVKRARNHHNCIVLKRYLAVWQVVIKARIRERKKVEEFRKEIMAKKVARMFKDWRTRLRATQKHGQLISGQMHKHNKLILKGCMRQWRKFIKKRRADKHYNTMLSARFFLEWKSRFDDRIEQKEKEMEQEDVAIQHYRRKLCKLCFRSWMYDARADKYLEMKQHRLVESHFKIWKKKCSLKAIASELGDRRMFAKYWSKWRHQLVRKRVSELMMKHEDKKLQSEVFGAWYRLTTIRRRLLNEWNIAMTEKWFRLWMQKYNDS